MDMLPRVNAKISMLSTGLDVAIVGAIVIHAIGKPVPWYLWVWVGLEACVCFITYLQLGSE
jgi:hypothetical protein